MWQQTRIKENSKFKTYDGNVFFRLNITHNIRHICYLPAQGLEYGPRAQFFSIRTDQGRQITCLFFFSLGNYFIRNICVDFFLLKQFHTVRVRLTFRGFFVWIIKFTFAMTAVIIRIHNCLTFCPMFTFRVNLQCYKKLLK